jgi:hypothetical protein
MFRQGIGHNRVDRRSEFVLAGIALLSLVSAQLLLSGAIPGTSYRGPDGGMIQANIFTAFRFADFFNVTNINPLQGIGSQLLPKNVWANPAFWPFAFVNRELATDLSSALALGCFALACYVMARCFDLPIVPSAITAQLCIVLFAPTMLIVGSPRNFGATPGDALVYAPYMVALGLLARLEPGSWGRIVKITIALIACILYSVYCDPAFAMIPAISWALAFTTVTLCPFRLRTVAIRGAAIACCSAMLMVSGVAVYLYTISQYSARVQYAQTVDRVRDIDTITIFPDARFHLVILASLLLGLVLARGRIKGLIAAAFLSWIFYIGYSIVYLLLIGAPWVLPQAIYVEQALFVLFITGAVASYWATLLRLSRWFQSFGNALALRVRRVGAAAIRCGLPRIGLFLLRLPNAFGAKARVREQPQCHQEDPNALGGHVGAGEYCFQDSGLARHMGGLILAMSVLAVLVIPAKISSFAISNPPRSAAMFYWPWANEPELVKFLVDHVGLSVGAPFRGSVNFLRGNEDGTIDDLWSRGVPTANEYSQTSSAPLYYFMYKMIKRNVPGMLNRFEFYWGDGSYSSNYWALAQLLGIRFTVDRWPLHEPYNPELALVKFPYHVPKQPQPEEAGLWYVYELPRPNLGEYSPTEVTIAKSGIEIVAALFEPGFDFTKQVVLTSAVQKPLVPARDLRLSIMRNGVHLSGRSDSASLIVLPQQFSHCLRAKDSSVRLVRADLLLTGVVFSDNIDTDISLDYGLFSPWCRLDDLADIKALDLRIDMRRPHLARDRLFPDWQDALARLQAAARALQML